MRHSQLWVPLHSNVQSREIAKVGYSPEFDSPKVGVDLARTRLHRHVQPDRNPKSIGCAGFCAHGITMLFVLLSRHSCDIIPGASCIKHSVFPLTTSLHPNLCNSIQMRIKGDRWTAPLRILRPNASPQRSQKLNNNKWNVLTFGLESSRSLMGRVSIPVEE